MLVVMKVISIAFDLDSGALKQLPNVWEYNGYVLCAGTSVFGVWTSFHEYQNIFQSPVWVRKPIDLHLLEMYSLLAYSIFQAVLSLT